ncbi:fumarylacetoacetate hydrolase family protein [Aspergillus caelatus]|uniref:Fumarylacetoacetate hydrolase family protein n=1 Tax=Aspergillus caelatus TaxID=61420 RepID=A0A5N7A9S1_9EURO|nr:fumarylacetoacetate hydrolase family protein [Aspergillus caelatus]KAE8366465.1 fumarylacetoacetate hydrolase family protein [Aspergillus caelatus]
MTSNFERLVRFRDSQGQIHYGEAHRNDKLVGTQVPIYAGCVPWDLRRTTQTAEIVEVLCPLPSVPIIYGIGMNYKGHIEEVKLPVPRHPVIFTKPPDALTGPYDDILTDSSCTNLDYEGELCVIIGKDCKDFTKTTENPLDYVLGYSIGNDVSSRFWQEPTQSGNQHGYAKSFDKFAPIGPVIASAETIASQHHMQGGNPDLQLRTLVNGEERQNSRTSDLLFGLSDILEHLSRGTTVRTGTVIMTGTPEGVAAFMEPPRWLRSGDDVQVEIEGIGKIKNRMVIA